jgi:type I restriction enzyme M protein
MTDIVGKLWGFRHTLRHDGIDYGDLTKRRGMKSSQIVTVSLTTMNYNTD